MRKRIVAGNWKMNMLPDEASDLYDSIVAGVENVKADRVIVCPPSVYIQSFNGAALAGKLSLGAQNCSYAESGAYTGETSPHMIRSLGALYCLVGHSERRDMFGEDDEVVEKKFNAILKSGLTPILCCGEQLEHRENGRHEEWVENQVRAVVKSSHTGAEFILAYEPVWAIGTGKTAGADQAQEMHKLIRSVLHSIVGSKSNDISILYGGSCNENNAYELFAQPDIDGGLIGGASLKADSFLKIANSFSLWPITNLK